MKLYLVDALFHIFRSYYALPRTLKAEDGTPTNVVHGLLGILRTLWRAEEITHIAVVFESLDGIFREELSADYKAHREPPPESLVQQIPWAKEACLRLGLPVWEVDGFEADDVIATLADRAVRDGADVAILSNDKDLAQVLALDSRIELLRTQGSSNKARLERIRQADVPQVFGVEAFQIPSFLALRGDAVDNIAGLKGVGEKTAVKWLSGGRTVDQILASPDFLDKRWADIVRQNETGLRRDLALATVRHDIDLESHGLHFSIDNFRPGPIDGLEEFYARLGMKRHLKELQALTAPCPCVRDLWSN